MASFCDTNIPYYLIFGFDVGLTQLLIILPVPRMPILRLLNTFGLSHLTHGILAQGMVFLFRTAKMKRRFHHDMQTFHQSGFWPVLR